MQITNPFSGSRINGRYITRRHHDLHLDKFSDYIFDVDRQSDSNEYYELKVHRTDDHWLLIKEPEKAYKF
jgi:hypothetical protein